MLRSTLFLAILLILGVNSFSFGQSEQIDNDQLNKVIQFSDSTGADKVLIIYNSEVIGSFSSTDCDSVYMNTASMVKSWTGLAVGILVDKGLIESENDKVCKYFPEWKSGCNKDVTIKQLLTMSSGLLKINPASNSILAQSDMNTFALNLEVSGEPGKKFSYSNEGVQLLGILIEKVTGKTANKFFTDNLFIPLGMDSTKLYSDEKGNDIVFGGTKTTIQDASKIGLLMLNNGVYKGKRIVSEEWIKKTISPSITASYYGYLWWLSPTQINTPVENYAAMGDFGQMTIIFPNKNLIYLRVQSCENEDVSKNMSWMGMNFINMIGSVIK